MFSDPIVLFSLILSGLLTGIAAGLFGLGGGTILIPLLLTIFIKMGVSPVFEMHIAIATSLALIIPTAISSSISQYHSSHLDLKFAKRWIPGICAGVIIGIFLMHQITGTILKFFFAIYLLACIIFNIKKAENITETNRYPSLSILITASTIIGCLSTLLGIGGGAFTTPTLTFFKYPLRKALAISAFTGLFIGGIGSIVILFTSWNTPNLPPFSLGYINWMLFLLIAPTAIIGSPFGVFLANRLTKKTLEIWYTILLLAIWCLMVYHLLR